jgi:hypothetical protein
MMLEQGYEPRRCQARGESETGAKGGFGESIRGVPIICERIRHGDSVGVIEV